MIWRVVHRRTGEVVASFEAEGWNAADRIARRLLPSYSRVVHNVVAAEGFDPLAGRDKEAPRFSRVPGQAP